MLPDGVMAVCMYVCIEAAPRRGIGGPIAAKDLHQILNVLIVLKSSFFNARTASVASTGAWPGVVLAVVTSSTGAWPGLALAAVTSLPLCERPVVMFLVVEGRTETSES